MLRADAGTDRLVLDPEQHEVIAALQQLMPRQREAIVLHHLAGYPVEQVAQRMEAPVGTVKSLLSRGRSRLADLLRDPAVTDD